MADSVTWRIPGLFRADAQKVSDEIHGMGDEVKPQEVLAYAESNPDSELHKCFEWDDTEAARKYRLGQARQVIQNLVIVTRKPDVPPIREYQITTQRSTYTPSRVILRKQGEYEALLQRALNELRAFEKKYRILSELENVFDAIDAL